MGPNVQSGKTRWDQTSSLAKMAWDQMSMGPIVRLPLVHVSWRFQWFDNSKLLTCVASYWCLGRFYCSSLLTCDALLIGHYILLKQQCGLVVRRETMSRCPCGGEATVGMHRPDVANKLKFVGNRYSELDSSGSVTKLTTRVSLKGKFGETNLH